MAKKLKIVQAPSFLKSIKKFNKNEKQILDNHIKKILDDPGIGTRKKGDLKDICVYKFKIKTLQYLLAYKIINDQLQLIMIGPHKNYYRDLKKKI